MTGRRDRNDGIRSLRVDPRWEGVEGVEGEERVDRMKGGRDGNEKGMERKGWG